MNIREKYKEYLISKEYAEKTVQQYLKEFDEFRGVIEDRDGSDLDCSKLVSEDIHFYQNYLIKYCKNKKGEQLKNATIVKRVEQLRSFNYFVQQDFPNVDLFKEFVQIKLSINKNVGKTSLSKEDIEKLLSVVNDKNSYKKYDLYLRNKLMVYILLHLGLKNEEMRKIKRSDIDSENKTLLINGKKVILTDTVSEHFKEWLEYLDSEKKYLLSQVEYKNITLSPLENNIVNSDYIFFSQREECIGSQAIHHTFKYLSDITKIEKLTPKVLIDTHKNLNLILN